MDEDVVGAVGVLIGVGNGIRSGQVRLGTSCIIEIESF